jgi:ketosteroid isomerase-like protein
MSEGNVELMRRFADAWNAGEIETVIACCDPDVEVHSAFAALGVGLYQGHDGVRDWLRDLEDAWGAGFRIEIERVFDLGEHTLAFSVWRGRGRHSGAEVAMQATPVARSRNGLLVYYKSFTQRDDALRELGVSESELEAAERPLPTGSQPPD